MNRMLLKNIRLLSSEVYQNTSIQIENESITKILEGSEKFDTETAFDLSGGAAQPGFIDIHNHGAVGIDVNTADVEGLYKISKFLSSKGVTAWVPTLVPDSDENYQKVISVIDELMETQDERESAARVLGVHYEGVFANEKMCGALRPQYFKTFAKGDEVNSLPRLKSKDAVHLTTLAPEIENGIELIKELRRQNWTVSIGHTRADLQTLNRAFEAGARQVTHLFNAMTGVHHRDIGVAGWALMNDNISCEIIADGHHVAQEILKFAFNCKTADRLMLVSDSVAPTGLGDGNFELWNEKISVVGGKTQNERGSIAGSVITMLDAFNMYRSFGISESEVSRMTSLTPARVLGIENSYGSIEVGKRADLVALDQDGNVRLTLVGGRIAFKGM